MQVQSLGWKETACQCRRYKRCRFNPWVGKIPIAIYSNVLAWRIHGQQRLQWATVHRLAKSQTQLKQFASSSMRYLCSYLLFFSHAQLVKNLPALPETQVWSLGWEDPLEKGMATHSSILAWRIPGTEEPGGLQSMELQRVRPYWVTNTHKKSLHIK